MEHLPTIIMLILILAIIGAAYYLVYRVKHKAEELSRTLFGTSDITKAASQMKQEYATTPKSVSAMTSLLLPKIVADFPDFQYNEMKDRAENVLTSYLHAITERNPARLTDGTTELKQQLENHTEMLFANGQHERFDQIHIHRTEINQYRTTAGRCIITFQTALECYHTITDSNGNITEGSSEYKYQTKFNTDLIYIQDRNLVENELDHALGLNCPNCGAPISSLGAKVCEYCGTAIVELNIHAWNFSHIEELY